MATAKAEYCKMENGRLYLSTSGMEKAFGVTRQALSDWEKLECPKASRGWWDLRGVMVWKVEREVGKIRRSVATTDKDRKLQYEADLKEAQAEMARLKSQIMQGDYLAKTDVIREVSELFAVFKERAMQIPREVAVLIAPCVDEGRCREVEAQLLESMRETLERFSDGSFT